MIPVIPIGFDYGNAETNVVMIDPQRFQRSAALPSYSGYGSLVELADKRSGNKAITFDDNVDYLEPGEYVFKRNGMELFIGKLALEHAKSPDNQYDDTSRYWGDRTSALLLTASAILLRDYTEYELLVVTGLPVKTYSKINRELVQLGLNGVHEFTLNGKKHKVKVHVARVIMEGAGALLAYGTAEDILQGCIDTGGRTTDLYASQGTSTQIKLCDNAAIGVENVAQLLSRQFKATYERDLSPKETRDIIRACLSGNDYPKLVAKGATIDTRDLQPWVKDCIRQVGNDIVSLVSRVWRSERGDIASDMKVIYAGGGAYYFGAYLKTRIPHLVIPEEPEVANALGYAKMALAAKANYTPTVSWEGLRHA